MQRLDNFQLFLYRMNKSSTISISLHKLKLLLRLFARIFKYLLCEPMAEFFNHNHNNKVQNMLKIRYKLIRIGTILSHF